MMIAFFCCAMLCFGWLPWWSLLPLSLAFGALTNWRWRQAATLALLIAAVNVIICLYIDRQNHHLISQKMTGILSRPVWFVDGLSAVISAWMVFFGIPLGAIVFSWIGLRKGDSLSTQKSL